MLAAIGVATGKILCYGIYAGNILTDMGIF